MQEPRTGRLTGRRIVITGAASGIGRATAVLFAQEGAALALFDRSEKDLADVARQTGGAAIVCDVTNPESVVQAVDAAIGALTGIDGLVHAAGVHDIATLEKTQFDLWQRVITTNLTGTYLICSTLLRHLKGQPGATVVTLGSGTALVPPGPGSAAYIASKGGVVAFSRALAAELAPAVRVNCVCPGAVDTPMAQAIMATGSKGLPMSNYALRRMAEPEEIATSILFLTSHESSYVSGATLAVDGGRTYH